MENGSAMSYNYFYFVLFDTFTIRPSYPTLRYLPKVNGASPRLSTPKCVGGDIWLGQSINSIFLAIVIGSGMGTRPNPGQRGSVLGFLWELLKI